MPIFIKWFPVCSIFFLNVNSYGQTLIWQEDFGSYADDVTIANDNRQPSGIDWSIDVSGADFGAGDYFEVQNNMFEANDTDGEVVWESETIDISAFERVYITIEGEANSASFQDDYMRVYYELDGGAEVLFGDYESQVLTPGSESLNFGAYALQGSSLKVIVKVNTNTAGAADLIRFDNISIVEQRTLYSIANADWDANGTWSVTSGGPSCVCQPIASDYLIVENSNNVVIDTDVELSGIEIKDGAALQWSGDNNFTHHGGPILLENNASIYGNGAGNTGNLILPESGINLNISNNGAIDFTDVQLLGSSINVSISGNGTLNMDDLIFDDDNGTIANNSTVNITNDVQIIDGEFLNSDDDNSIINNSDATLTITRDIDGRQNGDIFNIFGNFTINNYGSLTLNGTFTDIDDGSMFNNYDGATWNYGGTGEDADVQLFCDNGTNTFNYYSNGNQDVITPQDAYSNLDITGSGPKTVQADIIVRNDITVENSSVLDFDNNSLSLSGDFIINSNNPNAIRNLNGTVIRGGEDQTFGGTNKNEHGIVDFEINQTAGTKLVLERPVRITGSLTLNTGIVESSSANMLTLSANAISDEGNPNSYVTGPLAKEGSNDFVFPLGDQSTWAPMEISNLSGDANTVFTARYINDPYVDTAPIRSPDPNDVMRKVSSIEHWELENSGTASSADVTLYWKSSAASGIDDETQLVVAHYNSGNNEWENLGRDAVSFATEGSITVNGVDDFSPFTFGTTGGNNPLPIELKEFKATYLNKSVVLSWSTLSELNNDFFTIGRSINGVDYNEIGTIQANGTTNIEHSYKFIDDKVSPGTYYYKLKQTDYDGTYECFDPVSVVVPSNYDRQASMLNVYPNPISGSSFNLAYSGLNSETGVNVEIRDMLGRKVFGERFDYSDKDELEVEINGKLNSGVYTVVIISEGKTLKEKIVVN